MIQFRTATTFLLLCLAGRAQAQPSLLEFAPLRVTGAAWYASNASVGAGTWTAMRTIPLFFFLPRVSEDSGVDLFSVTAGIRSTNGDPALAWAVRPMELFLSKSPWAGGLTLLSYDRSGPFRLQAEWIGITAGPVLRLGREGRFVEARLLGKSSFSTFAMTGGLFPGDGERATGLDASLKLQVISKLTRTLALEVEASTARLFSGENPERREWKIGLRAGSGHITFATTLGQLQAKSQRFHSKTEWLFGASILVVPRDRGF